MATPIGIDVSNWNTVQSWQDAKADGVEVALIKATEGTGFVDPEFESNWAGAVGAGISSVVPYHFGHPANDPHAEADHFWSVAGDRILSRSGSSAMLDQETTDGNGYPAAAAWALAWNQSVGGRLAGRAGPIYYSFAAFIRSMGAAAGQLTGYPLDIAAYQSEPPSPSPWAKYTLWQRTDRGRVAGVYGAVDIDQLAPGSLALLAPATPDHQGGHVTLNKPISAVARTPSGRGMWLVGQDGGIFALGDAAPNLGNLPGRGVNPNAPVVGIAATSTGQGYWLVGSDGGVYNFGDAPFFGSLGGHHLNAPIVGIIGAPDDKGYGLVAADGGFFPYGDVPFIGSLA